MSDEDWGDLDRLPEKRQGPRLLFCGLGCLIPLLLLLAGGLWIKGALEDAMDPELQWSKLEELLPHEERPEGWQMAFGMQVEMIGAKAFILIKEEDARLQVSLLQLSDMVLSDVFERSEPWIPDGHEGPVETLSIQGRDLRVGLVQEVTATDVEGGTNLEFVAGERVVAVDVTPDTGGAPVLATFDISMDYPLSPEEILAFLAPFQLGPDR